MNWTTVFLGVISVASIGAAAATVKAINENTESVREKNKLLVDSMEIAQRQNEAIRRHNELMEQYLKTRNGNEDKAIANAIDIDLYNS